MVLFKTAVAFFRGNVKCIINKIFHAHLFSYSFNIRMYHGASVILRNNGKIIFGKKLKIDSRALLSSNGGKLILGDRVGIGRDNIIVSQEQICIGSGTILGPNVLIYDHDHKFEPESGVAVTEYDSSTVSIGTNCWIGANTIILKGTVIGDNCLIAAGSVIKGKFPNGSRVVQKRKTEIIGGCYENTNCN